MVQNDPILDFILKEESARFASALDMLQEKLSELT